MKTEIVRINSELNGKKNAVSAADYFNRINGITGKNAAHIRLLTEELISLVHGIMDGFLGILWLEDVPAEGGLLCRISLSAQNVNDPSQESRLLSIATEGKNENSEGMLGMIRELFRMNSRYSDDRSQLAALLNANERFGKGSAGVSAEEQLWSLDKYRRSMTGDAGGSDDERDVLEKSIIANLADDVKVWIRSDSTEVIIEKLIRL